MKAKTVFYCTECGNETLKWSGQCPACRAWNTLVEQPAETKKKDWFCPLCQCCEAAAKWESTEPSPPHQRSVIHP